MTQPKITHCEHCHKGPFDNDAALWNHPCPGRETTIQRAAKVLLGYRPQADGVTADLNQPVYEERELPTVGEEVERPGGRKAKVVSATVDGDSQVIGLRYID